MNGATMKSSVGVGSLPSGWSIVGTGDFNNDGWWVLDPRRPIREADIARAGLPGRS